MKTRKAIKLAIAAAVIITAAAVWLSGVMTAERLKNAVSAPLSEEAAYAEPTPNIQNPTLSELVTENENTESVFKISLNAFIDRYNSVYRQRNGLDYLNPENADNWYLYHELSPCFGVESVRHQFTADKTVWPMPTVSFYTSEDKNEIFEIRMTFDDHGYQERFHQLFKELCICMEKTMLPELKEQKAEALFEKLYSEAYDNFFGNHAYGDPKRPPLTAVTVCDKIGMYCFYGAGNIEICFLPLTEAAVNILKTENTTFDDFSEISINETE